MWTQHFSGNCSLVRVYCDNYDSYGTQHFISNAYMLKCIMVMMNFIWTQHLRPSGTLDMSNKYIWSSWTFAGTVSQFKSNISNENINRILCYRRHVSMWRNFLLSKKNVIMNQLRKMGIQLCCIWGCPLI